MINFQSWDDWNDIWLHLSKQKRSPFPTSTWPFGGNPFLLPKWPTSMSSGCTKLRRLSKLPLRDPGLIFSSPGIVGAVGFIHLRLVSENLGKGPGHWGCIMPCIEVAIEWLSTSKWRKLPMDPLDLPNSQPRTPGQFQSRSLTTHKPPAGMFKQRLGISSSQM